VTTPQSCCGDGVVDAGEQCDDGNEDNSDGCSTSCLESGGDCLGGQKVSESPSGKIILCDNPSSCEQDKGNDCPTGWHLCTLKEFNAYNDGWNYSPGATYVGAIQCRGGGNSGGAGHQTFQGAAGEDKDFNCWYGSSNPWCTSGYGCNEQDTIATCCPPLATCGNGVIDALETCDDSNNTNGDGCENNCSVTNPGC
jgi:cysteine-rich repeat protein